MLRVFPMILIAVIAYNVLVFGSGAVGQHDIAALLGSHVSLALFSGDLWRISLGDTFVAGALLLLFVEIIKAAGTSHREILNHGFSMLTFVASVVEFLVLKGFGTSSFFLITVMCLFDVVAGYSIAVVAAKRDLAVAPADQG